MPLNRKRKDENHHFFVFLFGDSIALLYICSVTRVAPMGYKVLNQRIRQQCRHWQGKGRWLVLKQPEGKNVNASNALKRGWSRHTKVVLARKQITLLFYECSVLRSDQESWIAGGIPNFQHICKKEKNHHFFVFLFGTFTNFVYFCSVTRVALGAWGSIS